MHVRKIKAFIASAKLSNLKLFPWMKIPKQISRYVSMKSLKNPLYSNDCFIFKRNLNLKILVSPKIAPKNKVDEIKEVMTSPEFYKIFSGTSSTSNLPSS